MNKFANILLIFLLALTSCNKTVQSKLVPADQAKLEEIKKALAEQARTINASNPLPSTATGSTLSEEEKKKIVSIRVTPPSLSVLEGLSETVSIIGRQADGREVSLSDKITFESVNPSLLETPTVAIQSRFTVKGLAPGRGSMNVMYGALKTNFEVQVKTKEILAIDVFPKSVALGTPTRFRLNVVYNNNTQAELSSGIYWETSSPGYLLGDGNSQTTGIYTGSKVGFGGLRANYSGQNIVSRIEIKMPKIRSIYLDSDTDTFLLGTQINIKAIATFVTGNSFNISSSVVWQSSDSTIASIGSVGDFEALFPGETQIKASYETISGSTPYYVTSVNFVDTRLEANIVTVPAGLSLNYKLWGRKVDNTEVEITSYSRWTVSDPTVLQSGTLETPKVPGRFTGVTPGSTVVSARYGTFTKTVAITVTEAAVMGLSMTTENPEGECGVNQPQMLVIATLSDGNSKDITENAVFTLNPPAAGAPHTDPTKKGLIVTTQSVAAKVIATYVEIKTGVTHTAEVPLSILAGKELGVGIQASSETIAYGEILELKAGQIMSCGTGLDYTGSSSWVTDNNSSTLNSYINTAGSKGIFSSAMMTTIPTTTPITVKVSAIKGTFRSDLNIVVRPREVKTIVVRTPAVTMDVGTTQQMTMNARYSDASSVDMIDLSLFPGFSVQYSVTDCEQTGCASVNAATGLITAGANEGRVKMYATLNTPQGYPIISAKVDIDVRSKCAAGTRVGLYCLYKSAKGATCTAACTAAGGTYHAATGTVFGKAGLAADCDLAIKTFGFTAGLETPNLNKGKGLGCSIYEITNLSILRGVREAATATSATEFDADFFRLCACTVP
ncbi:MAG: hypothetical protein EOP09_00675 [Proteobacteria bacterium]|nr:MAG: hypothetical protein EOP09_00675 [Pseudomonadota bacterium]